MNDNKLFYGTWELDGILKNVDEILAIELLKYAKSKGINKFDTAMVYGNGNVERMLSKIIDEDDIILTKIPAITKPSLDSENVEDYYPKNYVLEKISVSLNNLNRKSIDIVLLHNWSINWGYDLTPLEELQELKNRGVVRNIGISLPNNYNNRLSDRIVEMIDYIEVPYNIEDNWILNDIDYYKEKNVEIVFRSLFKQGMLLKNNMVNVKDIILFVKNFGVMVTIGMTSKEQIDENIELLAGE